MVLVLRVHGAFPKLVGIHFAEALVALDGDAAGVAVALYHSGQGELQETCSSRSLSFLVTRKLP